MSRFAIVVAVVAVVGLLPAAPAAASDCFPAGGVNIPFAEPPPGEFQVRGKGWGHGVGMSQFGAFGAALLGCSVNDILTTYYPGVQVAQAPSQPETLHVGLFQDVKTITVEAHTGDIPWQLGNQDATQPQGQTWVAEYRASDNSFLVRHGNDDKLEGSASDDLRVDMNASGRMIRLPQKNNTRYAHGRLEFVVSGGKMFVRVAIRDGGGDRAIDRYLWGLSEMPSSWEAAALQAQAITGRAYAITRWQQGIKDSCRCHLVDSAADQVYRGFDKEGGLDGANWKQAVDATAGRVILHDGKIATGFYSSSHGGQSESVAFSGFFNSPSVPYLRPVDDSRWEMAVIQQKGESSHWSLRTSYAFSGAQLGGAFGLDRVTSVLLPSERGAGGRVGVPGRSAPGGGTYGGVRVIGIDGDGHSRTLSMSGKEFMDKALTLVPSSQQRRTELFDVRVPECAPTSSQSTNEVVTRVSGADRIFTAIDASQHYWPDGATDVVLATAWDFADALVAGVFAAQLDAPLLLTFGNELHGDVRAELDRLDAETIHVMGGTAALDASVADALEADGYGVRRVAGADRWETAAQAAHEAGASPSGDVALALGTNWPDAVSAGALAASPDRIPVLLTTHGAAPQATLDALADLGPDRVLLIGGTAAIGQAVAQQLQDAGYDVGRLSGQTRFSTSLAVVADALGRYGDDQPSTAVLATGGAFPDALAAAAVTARIEGSLMLVPVCDLDDLGDDGDAVRNRLADPFTEAVIVGGTAAVSDLVREQATEALTGD